jgi:hypothetical protein
MEPLDVLAFATIMIAALALPRIALRPCPRCVRPQGRTARATDDRRGGV